MATDVPGVRQGAAKIKGLVGVVERIVFREKKEVAFKQGGARRYPLFRLMVCDGPQFDAFSAGDHVPVFLEEREKRGIVQSLVQQSPAFSTAVKILPSDLVERRKRPHRKAARRVSAGA